MQGGTYVIQQPQQQARQMMSWPGQGRSRNSSRIGLSDEEEETARSAILEKALKSRQPTDLLLRCTILDGNGTVKTISGRFKKSDLCTEHQLNPRDLRKIDVPNLVPTILVRKDGFLINILHIRALVKADSVILFDTYGSTETRLHSIFLYHLEHNLRSKSSGLPYEFRALDSILLSVLSALEAEMVLMRHLVGSLLSELEDDIDRDKFKRVLHYSRRLMAFQNRGKLVQQALEEVLEQDEDLAAMYLSDKKAGVPRSISSHDELEELLESFSKQVEEIVNETDTTISNVQSTQEIVELILDSNRNALLALDLKISIATMGIGFGALIAGFFGMNLLSHMEEHSYAFPVVVGVATVSGVVASIMGLRTMQKIRRGGLGPTVQTQRTQKSRQQRFIGERLARLHSNTDHSRWMSQ
ncbi:magnesium ion transporter [Tulasnella sp. 330]|nr:magnesium ion transporter [Tulasnella sp. 330]KAG8879964.1 magnesium ion transporter [Tulasnella sp. 331]KAG8886453.1 magnesium ion transporter [Tulasnella sp. 332]